MVGHASGYSAWSVMEVVVGVFGLQVVSEDASCVCMARKDVWERWPRVRWLVMKGSAGVIDRKSVV